MKTIITTVLAFGGLGIFAAEIPKAPVPPSPYLPIIYKFADAMLERGRDTNGLFYSALDRAPLARLTNRPAAPGGIREENRALARANPQHDQNFLRLLYTLSELSGKPKYREAADGELRWFVQQQRPQEFIRPWLLWDRCFEIAPKASEDAARSLLDNQQKDRRVAGFHSRTWAIAYARTKEERFLTSIERTIAPGENEHDSNVVSALSLAIDCDAAARLVPEPLTSRLRVLAERADNTFCAATASEQQLWKPCSGNTTAQVGLMCVSRYENTGSVEFRDVINKAADVYLNSLPVVGADAGPITFGHAIFLQLAAWRSTARQVYLDRARSLADFAVTHFFDQGPLPRASLKSRHYESITGADTLALALVELHLHILHITAVRWQSNTIDR